MTRQVGSALGVALFVAILGQPTPATVIDDYRAVWIFLIVCGLAAAAALLAIGPVRLAPGTPAPQATNHPSQGAIAYE